MQWLLPNSSAQASMYYGCGLPSAYVEGDSLFFGDHDEPGLVPSERCFSLLCPV